MCCEHLEWQVSSSTRPGGMGMSWGYNARVGLGLGSESQSLGCRLVGRMLAYHAGSHELNAQSCVELVGG